MANEPQCFDNPSALREAKVCLNALSKNVSGKMGRIAPASEHKCEKPACKTLTTVHKMAFSPKVNKPCDSKLAKAFGGTIHVLNLVTIFDQDGTHRGVHAGDFRWGGPGGLVVSGRISGVTNVGTHRPPVFKECQVCDEKGVMEGRLCGEVTSSEDPALKGCQVVAAYRLAFKASAAFSASGVEGHLEGVIICPCQG